MLFLTLKPAFCVPLDQSGPEANLSSHKKQIVPVQLHSFFESALVEVTLVLDITRRAHDSLWVASSQRAQWHQSRLAHRAAFSSGPIYSIGCVVLVDAPGTAAGKTESSMMKMRPPLSRRSGNEKSFQFHFTSTDKSLHLQENWSFAESLFRSGHNASGKKAGNDEMHEAA